MTSSVWGWVIEFLPNDDGWWFWGGGGWVFCLFRKPMLWWPYYVYSPCHTVKETKNLSLRITYNAMHKKKSDLTKNKTMNFEQTLLILSCHLVSDVKISSVTMRARQNAIATHLASFFCFTNRLKPIYGSTICFLHERSCVYKFILNEIPYWDALSAPCATFSAPLIFVNNSLIMA